jgi:phosphoglycolate phosphatase
MLLQPAHAAAKHENFEVCVMQLPSAPITPTVVFDLDGTLVHTVPDIAEALDIALAPYGVGRTTIGQAASMMGDGLSEFFWKAMVSKRLNLSAVEADAARRRFIDTYAASPANLSHVYPGIRPLLHELRERGVRTAVCTNKVEHIGSDILERFDLRRYFDAVVGSGGDRPMKPDPRPIIEAVSRAGGRMERALLVGDTSADHGAAIAARIPLVLLDYGYSHVPINALTYGIIVDNPMSLHDAVMSFVGMEHYLGPDSDHNHRSVA